jgi:hypothetical protein
MPTEAEEVYTVSTRATLEEIVSLAEARRLVRISYRRPGDFAPHEFVVEPYRLHRTASGAAAVHAWQVAPELEGRPEAWRDFRLDRITAVEDAGQVFSPRIPVTLGQELPAAGAARVTPTVATGFHWWGARPVASMGAAEDYFRQLEQSMLDGKVTRDEMALAQSLGERVEPHERKAAHARVYANVLHEVLQDGRISHREELYLKNVREFLAQLGWAP